MGSLAFAIVEVRWVATFVVAEGIRLPTVVPEVAVVGHIALHSQCLPVVADFAHFVYSVAVEFGVE